MSAERSVTVGPTGARWKDALRGHLERVRYAAERLEHLGVEDWRWTSPGAVDVAHHEVAVRTRELLRVTLDELEATQLSCQAVLESPAADARAVREAHDVDSLVFAARVDLQQFDHLLRRTHLEEDPFVTLELCQRAARHLRRSLGAVARVVATRLEVSPPLGAADEDDELEHARRLRTAYARLHREVAEAAADGGVAEQVAGAAAALQALLGDADFVGARLGDKRLLWQLHARARAWLDERGSAADGQRWLGDLRAVSELLLRINRREVLARHDLATLELAERATDDPHRLSLLLTRVEGLDLRLDRLRSGTVGSDELRAVVSGLLARLRAQRGGVA